MRLRVQLLASTAAIVLAGTLAAYAQSSGAEKEVLKAQAQRNKAIMAQDMKALEPFIADDLVWVHSSGGVENREKWLERVRTGASVWSKLDPKDTKAQVYGDVVILTGELHQTTAGPGRKPEDRGLRTVEVWAKRAGKWQLTDFQATRLPEPKPTTPTSR